MVPMEKLVTSEPPENPDHQDFRAHQDAEDRPVHKDQGDRKVSEEHQVKQGHQEFQESPDHKDQTESWEIEDNLEIPGLKEKVDQEASLDPLETPVHLVAMDLQDLPDQLVTTD